jgi:ribosome-interacting GTPase 1
MQEVNTNSVVVKMYYKGIDIEEISNATEVDLETVRAIIKAEQIEQAYKQHNAQK